ncbi:MAG: sodium:solute symporter family transporter [Verrucomicrobiota bacterium]
MSQGDYLVVGSYLLFLACTGLWFRSLNRTTTDFFAGSRRMTWWLAGADGFIANFSCWTFVGAAQIAYDHGLVIFGYYLADIAGFFLGYLWFAARFRQLRLLTPMDAVRLRFGVATEQFFTALSLLSGLLVAVVRVVSLTIILGSAFNLPAPPIVLMVGLVVICIGLVGGNWALAAANFVQLVVLMSVTMVVAIIVVWRCGGPGELAAGIPARHWTVLHPAGTIPYDWLFVAVGVLGASYAKNSLLAAGKYLATKDSFHARRSALVPMLGYAVMPLIWMIPPLAAFRLVPDLPQRSFLTTAGESSYIAVAMSALPPGMTGLLVVCLLCSTLANLGQNVNRHAAYLVSNIYRSLLRPRAPERELLAAGRAATVGFTLLIAGLALAATSLVQVPVFDAFLYITAYLGLPITTPLFLVLFHRRAPAWSAWFAALVGMAVTGVIYAFAPTEPGRAWLEPMLGAEMFGYVVKNPFVATNLVAVPLTVLAFWLSAAGKREADREGAEFYRLLETPVDFEQEVGGDNMAVQARLLGRLTFFAALFLLVLAFLADTALGRLGLCGCALLPMLVGMGLIRHGRNLDRQAVDQRR